MDVSNWINLGLFLLTGLGVFLAARSARSARRSESDARAFARAAIAAQERQAEAQERSATALEASVDIGNGRPHGARWELVPETDGRWRIFNHGPGSVRDIELSIEEDPSAFVPGTDLPKSQLAEGLAMTFFVARSLGSPADLTLVVKWRDADTGELLEWRAPL